MHPTKSITIRMLHEFTIAPKQTHSPTFQKTLGTYFLPVHEFCMN